MASLPGGPGGFFNEREAGGLVHPAGGKKEGRVQCGDSQLPDVQGRHASDDLGELKLAEAEALKFGIDAVVPYHGRLWGAPWVEGAETGQPFSAPGQKNAASYGLDCEGVPIERVSLAALPLPEIGLFPVQQAVIGGPKQAAERPRLTLREFAEADRLRWSASRGFHGGVSGGGACLGVRKNQILPPARFVSPASLRCERPARKMHRMGELRLRRAAFFPYLGEWAGRS